MTPLFRPEKHATIKFRAVAGGHLRRGDTMQVDGVLCTVLSVSVHDELYEFVVAPSQSPAARPDPKSTLPRRELTLRPVQPEAPTKEPSLKTEALYRGSPDSREGTDKVERGDSVDAIVARLQWNFLVAELPTGAGDAQHSGSSPLMRFPGTLLLDVQAGRVLGC